MVDQITWNLSDEANKTGITINDLFADFINAVTANAGHSHFKWEVASSNSTTHPLYVVLKRKDGTKGRILFLGAVTAIASAAVNPVLFDTTSVSAGRMYIAYFPEATSNTPLNLTSNAGGIFDNDSKCTKAAHVGVVSASYTAAIRLWYADSDAGILMCLQSNSSAGTAVSGAGDLVVDFVDDVVVPTAIGSGNSSSFGNFNQVATAATGYFDYSSIKVASGGSDRGIHVYLPDVGATNLSRAFIQSGWASIATASNSPMFNTALSRALFIPIILVQCAAPEMELRYKLRQIAFGPQHIGAFSVLYEVGTSTPKALSWCATNDFAPWLVNEVI